MSQGGCRGGGVQVARFIRAYLGFLLRACFETWHPPGYTLQAPHEFRVHPQIPPKTTTIHKKTQHPFLEKSQPEDVPREKSSKFGASNTSGTTTTMGLGCMYRVEGLRVLGDISGGKWFLGFPGEGFGRLETISPKTWRVWGGGGGGGPRFDMSQAGELGGGGRAGWSGGRRSSKFGLGFRV